MYSNKPNISIKCCVYSSVIQLGKFITDDEYTNLIVSFLHNVMNERRISYEDNYCIKSLLFNIVFERAGIPLLLFLQ